jgi:hypothetical protein
MAASNAFNIFAVQKAATVVGGVTASSLPINSNIGADITSAEIYPRIIFIRGQAPTLTFTTKSLATALTQFPILGTDFSASAFSMWGQKKADGGARSASADHEKWTINGGILVPTTLSVTGQEDAELSYEGTITFKTPTAAIVRTNATLPTGVTDADRYALGPLTVAGTALTGMDSYNLDFGITVQSEVTDGDITPTFAAISMVKPIHTWTGIDATWFNDITLGGTDSTTTVTTQVLRHRLKGGSFGGADLTVTTRGLATIENVFDGRGNDTGKVNLKLESFFDGTNVPVVIA